VLSLQALFVPTFVAWYFAAAQHSAILFAYASLEQRLNDSDSLFLFQRSLQFIVILYEVIDKDGHQMDH
jgi:hypothetical protein